MLWLILQAARYGECLAARGHAPFMVMVVRPALLEQLGPGPGKIERRGDNQPQDYPVPIRQVKLASTDNNTEAQTENHR